MTTLWVDDPPPVDLRHDVTGGMRLTTLAVLIGVLAVIAGLIYAAVVLTGRAT